MSPTVTWTETIRPVQIEQCRGARLLNEDTIPLWLKASDTDILGVIVDADGDCMARWNRISQLAKQYVPALPRAIPESGLVITTARSTVFGVWIMPDNKSVGMLETFLQALVPENIVIYWSLRNIQHKRRNLTALNIQRNRRPKLSSMDGCHG